MKNKKKKILALTLLFVVTVVFCACGTQRTADTVTQGENEENLKKVTFVLDWTPNTNHTGLYVAIERGYFKEAGLEVEVVQPPEDGAEVLVASGKAQFGVSFQDSLASALSGENPLPVKAVAAVVQHNTSGIISRRGEGISSPKGLEGKRYATWNGPMEAETIRTVMEKDGGNYEKLEWIPSTVTDEVSALKSHSVDALWIFYAWAGIKMEQEQLETDFFAFADVDPVFDYYTPVIISGTGYLQEEPEEAKVFMKALARGYEFAIENPKEAAQILCKAVPELDSELVLASQNYLADRYQAEAAEWGYIDKERWNRFFVWLNERGLADLELEEQPGFTNEYLPGFRAEPTPS